MPEKSKSNNVSWESGKVSFNERCKVLNQIGQVIWFTGLSASGKTTISTELEKRLINMGKAVYRLDGDNVRHGLNGDLGFSAEDRDENIRRIAEVAALFKDAGLITLAAFISPYQEARNFARKCAGSEHFYEIYVKADMETCAQRDPKGLYEKAFAGEIDNFTGVSAPYEIPQNPDLVLNTCDLNVEQCVNRVLGVINTDDYFRKTSTN